MSDPPGDAEQLTPPESRVQLLLAELREEEAPRGEELTAEVTRTVRWQRPLRRSLVSFGTVAGSLFGGLLDHWRTHGRKR